MEEKKTEKKEKEANIWRMKMNFLQRRGKPEKEKMKIFEEGEIFLRRRKTEKEKEEKCHNSGTNEQTRKDVACHESEVT